MTAIHIVVPDGTLTDFLTAEAKRRDCRPQQMALALISCAAEGELADAILDGADPGRMFDTGNDVVPLQSRVLRAMSRSRAPSGVYIASYGDIAAYLGTLNRGAIKAAIGRLTRRGFVIRVERGRAHVPSRYRLTEKAELFLKEIGR